MLHRAVSASRSAALDPQHVAVNKPERLILSWFVLALAQP
jgi:hypothetical protein